VMYGLTSEPQCLQTTNRSAPEGIAAHSMALPSPAEQPFAILRT
jgi:hypothetical protein